MILKHKHRQIHGHTFLEDKDRYKLIQKTSTHIWMDVEVNT